jgi:ubiquinone/menaquinone biosynthesis C-methylase UbiE
MRSEGRQAIRDHYSAISDAYARIEGIRGRQYTQPLVEALPLEYVDRILDVGTGPGVMIEAVKSKAPNATVIGVDLSPKMLVRARERTKSPVAIMDAMNLAFRDESLDIVTFSFSLFHLPSPKEGLTEAARVVRANGHLGIATFAESGFRGRPRAIIDELLVELGTPPRVGWPQYANEETSQDDLVLLVEQAGLSVVRAWTTELRFPHDRSVSDLLDFRTHRIESMAPEKSALFRERLTAALAELADEDFEALYTLQYLVAER